MKKLKVGLVGTGSISKKHFGGYAKIPGVEVVAACDYNKDRVESFAREYGIARTFTEYEKMFEQGDLDAVSICVWNKFHAPVSKAALNAGINVLCEKPMAINALEAESMIKAAKSTGKLLMIGLGKRFDLRNQVMKKLIEEGRLGRVYYAKAASLRRWGNPGGWFADREKAGGGPMIDMGVHIIDLVMYMTGTNKVRSVTGRTFNGINVDKVLGMNRYTSVDTGNVNNVEDMCIAMITFEDGMVLNVESSWAQNVKENSLSIELYGDKAGAKVMPEVEIYSYEANVRVNTKAVINPQFSTSKSVIEKEIEHFIKCIRQEEQCISTGEDCYELTRIIDAIYESAETEKEIIL